MGVSSSSAEPALVLTHDELLGIVARYVGEILTPEQVKAIAAERIDVRVGRLTLEEAMPRLGCKNARQVKDKCRALRIPVRTELGQKAPFILITDLEAANQRTLHVVPKDSIGGTAIRAVS